MLMAHHCLHTVQGIVGLNNTARAEIFRSEYRSKNTIPDRCAKDFSIDTIGSAENDKRYLNSDQDLRSYYQDFYLLSSHSTTDPHSIELESGPGNGHVMCCYWRGCCVARKNTKTAQILREELVQC